MSRVSRHGGARAAGGLAAAIALVACGDPAPIATAAPTGTRAAWVLEPPTLALGQVAVLELAVVTPPEHRVHPPDPPDPVPGLWVLDREPLPVAKEPSRWVHRSRLRVRAREVGRFTWPGGSVEVEAPGGDVQRVRVDDLSLEVVSALAEQPERLAPFDPVDVRAAAAGTRSALLAAAGGAIVALAGVAAVAALRRRRAPAAPDRGAPAAAEPPWIAARAALAEATSTSRGDPLAAAHAVALALRRYVAARFGADAPARTTEELEAAAPPFAAASRWPGLLAILRSLDEFRFRPPGERAAVAERVRGLVREAQAFVDDTTPPESLR